jgi:hypothetical protein
MGEAFGGLLDDIALWMVAGLLVAALVATLAPPDAMARWGSGLPAKVAMLAVGLPMYICATASTPIAAAMLLAGLSPGTVLVFLLAGPATNFATMGILRREMGGRTLAAYLAGISVTSVALGVATDWVVGAWGIAVHPHAGDAGELVPAWLAAACLAVLALAAIRPVRRGIVKALTRQRAPAPRSRAGSAQAP